MLQMQQRGHRFHLPGPGCSSRETKEGGGRVERLQGAGPEGSLVTEGGPSYLLTSPHTWPPPAPQTHTTRPSQALPPPGNLSTLPEGCRFFFLSVCLWSLLEQSCVPAGPDRNHARKGGGASFSIKTLILLLYPDSEIPNDLTCVFLAPLDN